MTFRMAFAITTVLSLMTAAVTASAVSHKAIPTVVAPASLRWSPTPFPGVYGATILGDPGASGLYIVFAKYESGAKARPHTHPDQRVVTVLSGTFYTGEGTQLDESRMREVKPGTVIIIPANAPHYGWAKDGEVILEEVGFGPSGINVLKDR